MKFAAGPPTDSTLACFYKIPEEFAYISPDTMSLQEAVLVEPLSIAVPGDPSRQAQARLEIYLFKDLELLVFLQQPLSEQFCV